MKSCRFGIAGFLILVVGLAHGQFGLRLKYDNQRYTNWTTTLDGIESGRTLFNPGYEVGLDYWFRLKKRRIEFMPELAYSLATSNFESSSGIQDISLTGFHFNFNTQIYALDMEGDCDCPTFSKQGSSINKGLFVHFTPGISYLSTKTNLAINPTRTFDEAKGIVFRAGLGLGLDIGVSDLLTITPIISYYFQSNQEWKNMPSPGELLVNATDNAKILQFTLRLGFRPDYGRKGRRRR